jgi:hypothetical protein
MDQRLEHLLANLRAFALTRPVAYGVPAVAMVGVLAGVAMKTGPQDGPYTPEMEPVRAAYEATAEPTAWPTGKVPDYVVGTDFLKETQAPPVEMVSYQPAYEPPPPMDIPPYVEGRHGPATPPPPAGAPQGASGWASDRGDILDVSLPEDRPQQQAPTVLADAAATGMTTR